MHSTETMTSTLPHSGLWTTYVRQMVDSDHRLVLRWCAHLEFEDVLRIDHGAIHAALHDPARILGSSCVVFGNGRFPTTIVPSSLVNMTQRHILARFHAYRTTARHDDPVFTDSFGEPITRASLAGSIRRALVLIRLSESYLRVQEFNVIRRETNRNPIVTSR